MPLGLLRHVVHPAYDVNTLWRLALGTATRAKSQLERCFEAEIGMLHQNVS
jgi:hypothetical protein